MECDQRVYDFRDLAQQDGLEIQDEKISRENVHSRSCTSFRHSPVLSLPVVRSVLSIFRTAVARGK